MARVLMALLAGALLAACDPGAPPVAEVAYRPVANVLQMMEWILHPAAEVIWDSAGFVITAEGETDLSPTSGEGWEHVRNSGALVAETGNLLMMPGRSAGPDWDTHSRALTASGELAIAAADARDSEALFAAAGEIYQACRGCHEQFLVPLQAMRSAR